MLKKVKSFLFSSRFKIAMWYSLIFLFLEILFGISVYLYLFHKSKVNLDTNLKAQATAILRIIEKKQLDLESFVPNETYKSEDELIWDILYDAIVFNRRNTFIQISNPNKIIFKTANLKNNTISLNKNRDGIFDYYNSNLSEHTIRTCILKGKQITVTVAYPIEQIVFMLNGLTEIYAWMAPIFFLVSILGGILISIKSLNRINDIIMKTEEITAYNLDEIILGGEYSDEFGRLVNKMNEMISRIKRSVEYMNQFSLAAAHELKTPLTILQGEIEVSLKSKKTINEYIEILESNYEETLRLIRIVDNLFFISKTEHSIINYEFQEIDLHSLLDSVVKKIKILGEDKEMSIELVGTTDVKIYADPGLLKQALSNLIDNAFKYGDEKSIVQVFTEVKDDKVYINVLNHGIGIQEKDIDKIFDKFYRVDSSRTRKTGGVGLGLSVVKSIVDIHKGKLEVKSIPHKETIFTIVLKKI
ncbi:MAG: sensor histidine kinase [Stygiobacter sp.]